MADYTLDCFSTSADFASPPGSVSFVKPRDRGDKLLDEVEYLGGLRRGELIPELASACNVAICQSDVSHLLTSDKLIITPDADIIDDMKNLIHANRQCTLAARQRLQQAMASIDRPMFYLHTLGYEGPIFARHPITGDVSQHASPFATLPAFSMSVTPFMCIMRAMQITGKEAATARSSRIPEHIQGSLVKCFVRASPAPPLTFYLDARQLGDFPERRVPYPSWQLDVPELTEGPTASSGKRTRSSTESSDSEDDSGDEEDIPMPDIDGWRVHTKVSGTKKVSDKRLSKYAREPVGIAEDMKLVQSKWRELLQRKADQTTSKTARAHYIRLAQPPVEITSKPRARRPTKRARQ